VTEFSDGELPPVGGSVVEAGIRQGRLFLTFGEGDLTPHLDGDLRERRLFLECDWHLDGFDFRLDEHSKEAALPRLCRLLDARLIRALTEETHHLALDFGTRGRLVVAGAAVRATRGDPWWLGPWVPALTVPGGVSPVRPHD
jgi:hypothetical protein